MEQDTFHEVAPNSDLAQYLEDFDRLLESEDWSDFVAKPESASTNLALTAASPDCRAFQEPVHNVVNPPLRDARDGIIDNVETTASPGFDITTIFQASSVVDSAPVQTPQVNTTVPSGYSSRLPRRRSKYQIRRSISGESSVTSFFSPIPNTYVPERPVSRGRSSAEASSSHRSGSQSSFDSRGSSSALSAASSRSTSSTGFRISRSRSKSQRKKRGSKSQRAADDDRPRPFKCTFCCDSFKSKYDWTRHERTLHLNLETWICTPKGGVIMDDNTASARCAYCSSPSPDTTHLESHLHQLCISRAPEQRCFRRKDHIFQHLRFFHKVTTIPSDIDSWKSETENFTSRCGFCSARLQSWHERSGHLAMHFRQGRTMKDWKGDHEFEEQIAAQVRNALPPYYIYTEGLTPLPFSATNPHAKDQHAQISSQSMTSADQYPHASPFNSDILTLGVQANDDVLSESIIASRARVADTFSSILFEHLGRFAQEQMKSGVVVTDDMLRREARIACCGHDDGWDQTIADNPEWMAMFRQRHGLIPALEDGTSPLIARP